MTLACRTHAYDRGVCILCDARCMKAEHYPQLILPEEYDIRLHSGSDCR